MMKRMAGVCALWLAFGQPAEAQPAARLRGVVYDSVSRAPLANAAIRVFRSDNAGEGVDARTDSTGAFSVSGLRAGT